MWNTSANTFVSSFVCKNSVSQVVIFCQETCSFLSSFQRILLKEKILTRLQDVGQEVIGIFNF